MNGKPKVERICEWCNKSFWIHQCKIKNGKGKFCSVKCANTNKNKTSLRQINTKRIRVECKECHNIFETAPSNYRRGKGRFCSPQCARLFKSKTNSKICICKHCGRNFSVKNSSSNRKDAKKNGGIFCSKKCMNKSRENRTSHKCIQCGAIFQTRASSQNKNLFCCRRCYIEYGGRTSIEIKMTKSLDKIGCLYCEQKLIKNKKIWTYVDFFIEPNICLYVDGDYWHSLPENIERDLRNNKWLSENGYTVIRITESTMQSGENHYIPIITSHLRKKRA